MMRCQNAESELWALLEMTDAVGSSLEVGQVMRSIVHLVGDLVDTESCSILLDPAFHSFSTRKPVLTLLPVKL